MTTCFSFDIPYRSQSEAAGLERPSLLVGRWRHSEERLACDIQQYLESSVPAAVPLNLRTADVRRRAGVFAEIADALYYAGNSPALEFRHDILDCTKLAEHWTRRRPLLARIGLEGLAEEAEGAGGDVTAIAAAEYLLHEAGHRMGFGLFQKMAAGHFRTGGKLRWPLIFFEEHRADSWSFTAAAAIPSAGARSRLAAYHVSHRLGLALEAAQTGRPPAGLVPFLLFATLWRLEAIAVDNAAPGGVRLRLLASSAQVADMLTGHAEALASLDADAGGDPLDTALAQAGYVRKCLADEACATAYNSLVN